ncbi:MAG: hypothetical protein ACHQUC_02110 [Chlamydiales bacterium]
MASTSRIGSNLEQSWSETRSRMWESMESMEKLIETIDKIKSLPLVSSPEHFLLNRDLNEIKTKLPNCDIPHNKYRLYEEQISWCSHKLALVLHLYPKSSLPSTPLTPFPEYAFYLRNVTTGRDDIKFGFDSLTECVKTKDHKKIKQCLDGGGRPDSQTLTYACIMKNRQILITLPKLKADDEALTAACSTKDPWIVGFVILEGGRPTEDALKYALKSKNPQIIQIVKLALEVDKLRRKLDKQKEYLESDDSLAWERHQRDIYFKLREEAEKLCPENS